MDKSLSAPELSLDLHSTTFIMRDTACMCRPAGRTPIKRFPIMIAITRDHIFQSTTKFERVVVSNQTHRSIDQETIKEIEGPRSTYGHWTSFCARLPRAGEPNRRLRKQELCSIMHNLYQLEGGDVYTLMKHSIASRLTRGISDSDV